MDGKPQQITVRSHLSQVKLLSLQKFINEALELKVIEKGVLGDWKHSLLAVPHLDKSKIQIGFRWCGNLTLVNRHFQKLAIVTPTLKEIIENLQRYQFKAIIDLQSAFWAMPIAVEQRKYLGFTTPLGEFRWMRAPFGHINAPANQQMLIDSRVSTRVATSGCLLA